MLTGSTESAPLQKCFGPDQPDAPCLSVGDADWEEPSTEASTTSEIDSGSDCDDSEVESSTCVGSSTDDSLPERLRAYPRDVLTIFDWDDTLLPTSWLEARGLRLDSDCIPTEEQRASLLKFAGQAARAVRAAKRFGKVLLVTNAEEGWVERSCAKFLPSLGPVLRDLSIYSARSTYEPLGVRSATEWKRLAFDGVIQRFCGECDGSNAASTCAHRRCLISVGDSSAEREALIRAAEGLQDTEAKALRLASKPEVEQLADQLKLISGCFRDIVNYDGSLDLRIRCQ